MSAYNDIQAFLRGKTRCWLVTGAAGFIGSNLAEALLNLNQRVIGLDNFSTGRSANLDDLRQQVGELKWAGFKLIEADICDPQTCMLACTGVDYVLHQAALGSVPRSIADPVATNQSNVTGFVNIISAAREAGAKRFVYASSSSVYGDHPALPKVEEQVGSCFSPYAVSKRVNELYADVFSRCYGMECVGLRYFNVFGPRQDPDGPYAAVIPKWIDAMIQGQPVQINGDGETSRDFCYVANAVQANLLAATTENPHAVNQVFNVAVGERTTLNELFLALKMFLAPHFAHLESFEPTYGELRAGDVRHSLADIDKARRLLGYEPTHRISEGLAETVDWYLKKVVPSRGAPAEVFNAA